MRNPFFFNLEEADELFMPDPLHCSSYREQMLNALEILCFP